MSVLAIDIGNSRVGLGVFTMGRAQDPGQRLTHAQLDGELAPLLRALWKTAEGESHDNDDGSPEIVIASVVPALTAQVEQTAIRELGTHPRRIAALAAGPGGGEGGEGEAVHVPLKTKLRDESTVGQDRLLAALAAYVHTEQACAIVHVGTALVVDCIDPEGIFCGGAIAPGLQMAAKALHEYTAQLPSASLTPPEDAVPFGRYTQEAINLGIYAGARGAVRELIERYATALGTWPHVVATGGDAQALLGGAAEGGVVDSFIPDLVLQGAALAWEHARKQA